MTFISELKENGRFPGVEIRITPRRGQTSVTDKVEKTILINQFLNYQFVNSMLVPVDAFSFTFAAPGDSKAFTEYVLEGDIITVYANREIISTGIVDQIEIECDGDSGEKVTVNGRNLIGQLEDQTAVSVDMQPIYIQEMSAIAAITKLIEGTIIPRDIIDGGVPLFKGPLGTMPGESKLSAILRFLEPINCLIWSQPDGKLIVGKPDFGSAPVGRMIMSKKKRSTNVLSIRVTRSATSIPSRYVAFWNAAEEIVQYALEKSRIYENKADGPKRLLAAGHTLTKGIMTSLHTAATAAGADTASRIKFATEAGTQILDQYAFREMARDNFNEILVTCVVPGHCNESGNPFQPDTVYQLEYDRASLQENMYLYSVDFQGSAERGQWSVLNFCRLGTIVDGARIVND
jgi:prophage tail gpP-like protein